MRDLADWEILLREDAELGGVVFIKMYNHLFVHTFLLWRMDIKKKKNEKVVLNVWLYEWKDDGNI